MEIRRKGGMGERRVCMTGFGGWTSLCCTVEEYYPLKYCKKFGTEKNRGENWHRKSHATLPDVRHATETLPLVSCRPCTVRIRRFVREAAGWFAGCKTSTFANFVTPCNYARKEYEIKRFITQIARKVSKKLSSEHPSSHFGDVCCSNKSN